MASAPRDGGTVMHIITGLDQGGAETVLYRLTTAQAAAGTRTVVVSLMDHGFYGPKLAAAGVVVHTLGMPRGRLTWRGVARLYHLIRHQRPALVQTWMYHADLVGGVVAFVAGQRAIFWGIRNSTLDVTRSSRATRAIVRVCALLSRRVPRGIVCCSQEAVRVHADAGYRASKMVVIPNGYDLGRFAPASSEAVGALRAQWNLPAETIVVGCVARWDPQKDHATLLRAFAQTATVRPCVLVLVGNAMEARNDALTKQIADLGLQARVRLLGSRDDVPALMSAFDWHVLASAYGEAFPNVVAESMACAVPNIVTDVGDAAMIVGDCGEVVPPRATDALAAALVRAAAMPDDARRALGARCRARIAGSFALEKMVDAYARTWAGAARD